LPGRNAGEAKGEMSKTVTAGISQVGLAAAKASDT